MDTGQKIDLAMVIILLIAAAVMATIAVRDGLRSYHDQNTGLTPGQGAVYTGGYGDDSTQAGHPHPSEAPDHHDPQAH